MTAIGIVLGVIGLCVIVAGLLVAKLAVLFTIGIIVGVVGLALIILGVALPYARRRVP